jgi:peptidyl-prolyl cis-trans isomerase C
MVDLKLGARAAEAAKVGENGDFSRRLAYVRDKLLLDDYLEGQVKTAVTPEAARKLYDDTVKNLKPEEEVRARHILVEGEEEAKAAAERVRKGEDFAKVAGEVSKDPGSKRTAATSASSRRNAWSRPSRRQPSSSSRGRCPIRSRASSAGT